MTEPGRPRPANDNNSGSDSDSDSESSSSQSSSDTFSDETGTTHSKSKSNAGSPEVAQQHPPAAAAAQPAPSASMVSHPTQSVSSPTKSGSNSRSSAQRKAQASTATTTTATSVTSVTATSTSRTSATEESDEEESQVQQPQARPPQPAEPSPPIVTVSAPSNYPPAERGQELRPTPAEDGDASSTSSSVSSDEESETTISSSSSSKSPTQNNPAASTQIAAGGAAPPLPAPAKPNPPLSASQPSATSQTNTATHTTGSTTVTSTSSQSSFDSDDEETHNDTHTTDTPNSASRTSKDAAAAAKNAKEATAIAQPAALYPAGVEKPIAASQATSPAPPPATKMQSMVPSDTDTSEKPPHPPPAKVPHPPPPLPHPESEAAKVHRHQEKHKDRHKEHHGHKKDSATTSATTPSSVSKEDSQRSTNETTHSSQPPPAPAARTPETLETKGRVMEPPPKEGPAPATTAPPAPVTEGGRYASTTNQNTTATTTTGTSETGSTISDTSSTSEEDVTPTRKPVAAPPKPIARKPKYIRDHVVVEPDAAVPTTVEVPESLLCNEENAENVVEELWSAVRKDVTDTCVDLSVLQLSLRVIGVADSDVAKYIMGSTTTITKREYCRILCRAATAIIPQLLYSRFVESDPFFSCEASFSTVATLLEEWRLCNVRVRDVLVCFVADAARRCHKLSVSAGGKDIVTLDDIAALEAEVVQDGVRICKTHTVPAREESDRVRLRQSLLVCRHVSDAIDASMQEGGMLDYETFISAVTSISRWENKDCTSLLHHRLLRALTSPLHRIGPMRCAAGVPFLQASRQDHHLRRTNLLPELGPALTTFQRVPPAKLEGLSCLKITINGAAIHEKDNQAIPTTSKRFGLFSLVDEKGSVLPPLHVECKPPKKGSCEWTFTGANSKMFVRAEKKDTLIVELCYVYDASATSVKPAAPAEGAPPVQAPSSSAKPATEAAPPAQAPPAGGTSSQSQPTAPPLAATGNTPAAAAGNTPAAAAVPTAPAAAGNTPASAAGNPPAAATGNTPAAAAVPTAPAAAAATAAAPNPAGPPSAPAATASPAAAAPPASTAAVAPPATITPAPAPAAATATPPPASAATATPSAPVVAAAPSGEEKGASQLLLEQQKMYVSVGFAAVRVSDIQQGRSRTPLNRGTFHFRNTEAPDEDVGCSCFGASKTSYVELVVESDSKKALNGTDDVMPVRFAAPQHQLEVIALFREALHDLTSETDSCFLALRDQRVQNCLSSWEDEEVADAICSQWQEVFKKLSREQRKDLPFVRRQLLVLLNTAYCARNNASTSSGAQKVISGSAVEEFTAAVQRVPLRM